jgi:hypothetical protein
MEIGQVASRQLIRRRVCGDRALDTEKVAQTTRARVVDVIDHQIGIRRGRIQTQAGQTTNQCEEGNTCIHDVHLNGAAPVYANTHQGFSLVAGLALSGDARIFTRLFVISPA